MDAHEDENSMDHSNWTSLSATCKPRIPNLWPKILKFYTTNLKQKLAANHLLGSQGDSFGAEATPLAAQEMICNKLLAQCQRISLIKKSARVEIFSSIQRVGRLVHAHKVEYFTITRLAPYKQLIANHEFWITNRRFWNLKPRGRSMIRYIYTFNK